MKIKLKVEIRDPKSLTQEERIEQDRRWELVQKLLKNK